MDSRFYLGTLIDINKDTYLPIMSEQYNKINALNTVYSIVELSKLEFIHITPSDLYIRNAYTLEVVKKVTPSRPIINSLQPPVAVNDTRNKIYCITSDTPEIYYLSIYDFTIDSWEDMLLNIDSSQDQYMKYISNIFIDGDIIYFYCKTYGKIFKYSISNSSLISSAMLGTKSQISFDGTYFYVPLTKVTSMVLTKVDKDVFSVVATSAEYYSTTSSSEIKCGQIVVKKGYVYLTTMVGSGTYNITKLEANTLKIIAGTGDSIVQSYADGLYVTDDDRIFGTYNGGSGNGSVYEFDINTLSIIKGPIALYSGGCNKIIVNEKNGTILAGSSSFIWQLERSYTIQSYKKIKESVL